MDRVDVFSKNAAVRNALWWDKLYLNLDRFVIKFDHYETRNFYII